MISSSLQLLVICFSLSNCVHFSGSSRVVDAYRSPPEGVTGTPERVLGPGTTLSNVSLQLYIKIVYFFINVTNKYT